MDTKDKVETVEERPLSPVLNTYKFWKKNISKLKSKEISFSDSKRADYSKNIEYQSKTPTERLKNSEEILKKRKHYCDLLYKSPPVNIKTVVDFVNEKSLSKYDHNLKKPLLTYRKLKNTSTPIKSERENTNKSCGKFIRNKEKM